MRRKTLEIAPDPGNGRATAVRTTYDDVGRVTETAQGVYVGASFQPLLVATLGYDAVGNKVQETTAAGITQFSYDAMNRVVCTARRMNPDAALPGDACALAPRGPFGFDQIARNEYYDDGALKRTTMGLGTSAATDFVSYEYSANGQKTFVIDGVCNVTKLEYDGFDRLVRQYYPSKTRGAGCQAPGNGPGHPGAFDTADYDEYAYDPQGNRRSWRKRDGKLWTYEYDGMNRLVEEIYAADTTQNVNYTYDAANRPKSIGYGTHASKSIVMTYDGAGRVTDENSYNVRKMLIGLDQAGNRNKITWPDGFAVDYVYDAANRLREIREASTVANARVLATFEYDDLGRRTHMYRGNGTQADYAYNDPAGRLTQLTQGGGAGQPASVQTLGWTPASQLASLTQASLAYVWQGQPSQTLDYTFNGLNQDAGMAALPGYDGAGNLINSGVRSYLYDARNRMIHGNDGTNGFSIAYDPMGRLRATLNSSNASTYFLYVGDRLSAEYADATSGSPPLRRYVFADGVDEPIVWYDGADNTQPKWLHADRQGSIIAHSDVNGAVTPYTYSPYGEPGNGWSGSRFRYTGQVALPEIQAYFYKARIYDPALGRFLQTDPIGFEGGNPNVYAYVNGDPANRIDPDGNVEIFIGGAGDEQSAIVGEYKAEYERSRTARNVEYFQFHQTGAIQAAIKAAALRGEPINIIGHSLGGGAALNAARVARVPIANVITIDPVGYTGQRPMNIESWTNVYARPSGAWDLSDAIADLGRSRVAFGETDTSQSNSSIVVDTHHGDFGGMMRAIKGPRILDRSYRSNGKPSIAPKTDGPTGCPGKSISPVVCGTSVEIVP